MLSACGGGSKNDEGNDTFSAFDLKQEDFDVSPIFPLSEAGFKSELNATDGFVANEEDLLSNDSAIVDCIQDKMGTITARRSEEGTYQIKIPDVDLIECFSTDEFVLESAVAGWYLGNIIYKDKFGNEVIDDELHLVPSEQAYTAVQANFRTYLRMRYNMKIGGVVYKVVVTQITSENKIGEFDQPCQQGSILTNCTNMFVLHLDFPDYPIASGYYKKVLNADSLNIVPDGIYFTAGEMQFTINDWTGVMHYDSDASTPPTYEASNGSVNITGTYEGESESPSQKLLISPVANIDEELNSDLESVFNRVVDAVQIVNHSLLP
ncbi:MAG: hypothetical protein R3240_05850 [Gammaproteobacteria bacterium]|nr:hypothetical protein [Gammaproteobacteria bacterium]